MKWAREQDPPDEEPSKPACTLHSCPEAESEGESEREGEEDSGTGEEGEIAEAEDEARD